MSEAIGRAAAAISTVLDQSLWALPSADLVAQLQGLEAVATQVRAAQALMVRELAGRDWPKQHGATSISTWLRDQLRTSISAAHRTAALGRQIDTRPQIRAAIDTGGLNIEQAAVIGEVITDLPATLDPALVDKCETALIGYAAIHEPGALRRLGDRILAHVAPDVADAELAKKLDRDEAAAVQQRCLTITDSGDGSHRISGKLDTESAAILRSAIDPLCRPIPGTGGERDPRTPAQRRADALVEVCRFTLAHDDLPVNGGNRPQLTITTSFDTLTKELSTGSLDVGGTIAASAVRRIACDAGILPAVLGGRGEILDLGRERRLFTGTARRAIVLRDGGCAFPGCDRPPRWCAVHHLQPWMTGGQTNIHNGVLLCGYHHRLIHLPHGWQVRMGGDDIPDFIPPAHIDRDQKPLRNIYHLRT